MSTRPMQWPGDDESKPAPGRLMLVQALINTVERPDGSDRLAEIADARPWLVDNHLLAPHAELSDADLDLVRAVRESLRAMLVHNAGGPPPNKPALAVLRSVADGGAARADLRDDGEVRLSAHGDSVRDRRQVPQPRRHVVRDVDVWQQAEEPRVPRQEQGALTRAVRSTSATPGPRPARPALSVTSAARSARSSCRCACAAR